MGTSKRAVWHPDPETSSSPYIRAQAAELRTAGWVVDPLRITDFFDRDAVIHIHWPEHLVRSNSRLARGVKPVFVGAVLALLQSGRGAAVVWTVHNLRPHRAAPNRLEAQLESALFSVLAQKADVVTSLISANIPTIRSTFDVPRSTPVRHVPEGISEASKHSSGAGRPARLLAIGALLEYKNLPHLAAAAASVGATNVRLQIAGEPLDQTTTESLHNGNYGDAVELIARRISDEDLQALVPDVDAVVVAHSAQFNSGAPYWALSQGLPVITVESNLSAELVASVGASWVFELPVDYSSDDLRNAIDWLSQERDRPVLSQHGWPVATERLTEVYAEALDRRSS